MNEIYIDSPEKLREMFVPSEEKVRRSAEDTYRKKLEKESDREDLRFCKESYIEGFIEGYYATVYLTLYDFAANDHTSISVITKATGLSESEFLSIVREEFCRMSKKRKKII